MKIGWQTWACMVLAVLGAAGCPSGGTGTDGGTAGVPGAPTAVTGVGGAGSIEVSWTAPRDTGSSALTGYTVTVNPGAVTVTVDAKTTTANVEKLVGGQTFSVSVVAKNARGSGPAGTASVKLPCTLCGFGSGPVLEVAGGPNALVWGDFNGDGKPDLAIAAKSGSGVAIQLNNGNGTFRSLGLVPVASSAFVIYAVDLNGDGKLDLVVGGAVASVLLGNGDGTFAKYTFAAIDNVPGALAVVDVNGDGKLDLVEAAVNVLAVSPGKGDGTFGTAVTVATTGVPKQITVADFNGDGKPDVMLGASNQNVTLHLGNGDGTFQAVTSPIPMATVSNMLSGDFNGDGKLDVYVAGNNGESYLYLGNGAGAFTFSRALNTYGAVSVHYEDVNGDGIKDLVSLNPASVTGSWLAGKADGDFVMETHLFLTGANPSAMAIADMDGDGHPDIAVANQDSGTVTITSFNATGARGDALASGFIDAIVLEDVNGDGKLDVVASGSGTTTFGIIVALNKGDGTFDLKPVLPTGPFAFRVAVADLNTDGKPDVLAFQQGFVHTFQGNGDGTFGSDLAFGNGEVLDFAVSDMDGDGKSDLVLARNIGSVPDIGVRLGKGDGTFLDALSSPSTTPSTGFITADLNGDSRPDFISTHYLGGVSVQLNKGNGTFAAPVDYPLTGDYAKFAAADLYGDGKLSLVAVAPAKNVVSVFRGKGDGTLEAPIEYAVGMGPSSVTVSDLNLDGFLDIAVGNSLEDSVTVLFGKPVGGFNSPVRYPAARDVASLAAADMNGDGKVDLFVGAGVQGQGYRSEGLRFLRGLCFQ